MPQKQATKPRAAKGANGAKAQEQKLPDFPVRSLTEALPYLRQPFAPGAVGFKPQHQGDTNTLCVAYIDARTVIERLNLVVGPDWTATFSKADSLGSNLMWCHLELWHTTRSDVGEGTGKALVSDSLKRAAVHFGIGRSLYASSAMFVKTSELQGSGKSKTLSEKQRLKLRGDYEKWLTDEGIGAFGPVLHHGDTPSGSVGVAIDPEGGPEQESKPKPEQKLDKARVEKLATAVSAAGLDDHLDAKLRGFGVKAIADLTYEQGLALYEWAGAAVKGDA